MQDISFKYKNHVTYRHNELLLIHELFRRHYLASLSIYTHLYTLLPEPFKYP